MKLLDRFLLLWIMIMLSCHNLALHKRLDVMEIKNRQYFDIQKEYLNKLHEQTINIPNMEYKIDRFIVEK